MIKKDTLEYKIVSIIGLAGEMRTSDLYELKCGKKYLEKVMTSLRSKGYIKSYKAEDKRCVRITGKCKRYLSENYSERFSGCFEGQTSTNRVRSELQRRIRRHRLGKLLALADAADIKVFADEKSLLKNTHAFSHADGTDLSFYCAENKTAEFYTTAELKKTGLFINARTSRALGIIFSYPDIYIVYDFGDGNLRWENKTELTLYYDVKMKFYKTDFNPPRLIFIGDDSDVMQKILKSRGGYKGVHFKIDNRYDNICFLDSSKSAAARLEMLVNHKKRKDIQAVIDNNFMPKKAYKFYGETSDGALVFNCTECNLIGLKNLKEIQVQSGVAIKVICFEFQAPYIYEYIGNRAKYYQIDIV